MLQCKKTLNYIKPSSHLSESPEFWGIHTDEQDVECQVRSSIPDQWEILQTGKAQQARTAVGNRKGRQKNQNLAGSRTFHREINLFLFIYLLKHLH